MFLVRAESSCRVGFFYVCHKLSAEAPIDRFKLAGDR
jgi:hypothetical protein